MRYRGTDQPNTIQRPNYGHALNVSAHTGNGETRIMGNVAAKHGYQSRAPSERWDIPINQQMNLEERKIIRQNRHDELMRWEMESRKSNRRNSKDCDSPTWNCAKCNYKATNDNAIMAHVAIKRRDAAIGSVHFP